ncbi:MAG: hypothetical protein KAU14_09825, partial [Thermoplasmata archaeon]|nr:hypothetical protein [Thermoplasmata archaeon]
IKEWQKQADEVFSRGGSESLWGGRPDILVEKYHQNCKKPCQVFIGEVKYTTYPSYAAQGLKELLEYMALVKKDTKYFEKSDKVFKPAKIHGWLFLDKMETDKPAQGNISVIKFGDDDIKEKILPN